MGPLLPAGVYLPASGCALRPLQSLDSRQLGSCLPRAAVVSQPYNKNKACSLPYSSSFPTPELCALCTWHTGEPGGIVFGRGDN